MQKLAKNTIGLAGLVLLLALASGCSVTRRYVTHTVSGTGGPSAMATLPQDLRVGGPEDEAAADAPADGAEAPAEAMPAPAPMPAAAPATATRWMYIAYAEVKETNLFIMKQFKTTSKVLRCLINDDNSVTCNEQEEANRLFNPQNK